MSGVIFVNEPTVKQKIITLYFFIALIFAIYWAYFGDYSYKGFGYNLGRALVWPAIVFPSFGWAVGSVVIVALCYFAATTGFLADILSRILGGKQKK